MNKRLALVVLLILAASTLPSFLVESKPTSSKYVNSLTKEAQITRWGGAASLKVKPTTQTGVEVSVTESPNSFEYSWILASKPATNAFTLKLTFTGCTYYYQGPLTEAEKKAGYTRPENVVGSYAVYSENKNGIYETGKVAHIYRPYAVDAKGNRIWCNMEIVGDTLTVTVDQAWLNKAVYPVVVDPVFGYNTIGASSGFLTANTVQGSAYTTAASAYPMYAQSISFYASAGAGTKAKLGIWVNSNGGAVLAVSNVITSGGGVAAWNTAAFATPYLLAASTTYQLGAVPNNTWTFYYDNAGGTGHVDNTNSYAAPAAYTWDSTNAYRYSIYVTFTYGPQITSSVITDIDDSTNFYAMKQYYTFTTVITDGDGATDIDAISIRATQNGTVRWMVNATNLTGVAAYAVTYGSGVIQIDSGSCSFTEAGTDGTLVLKIRARWNATNEASLDLDVYAEDSTGLSVGWTTVHADYFSTVTRLVTHQFSGNLTSTTINMPVQLTGYVRYSMTPTGYNASTSYPPDAQFTSVKIYDSEGNYAGVDTAIVNGYYNLTITSAPVLKTSYYYAWLDLASPYVDGYAVDADYVAVTTAASFSIVEQVNEGFAFFGLIGNVTGVIIPTITSLATWFSDSATAVVDMATGVFAIVIYLAGTLTYWVGAFSTFFIDLFDAINRVAHGTGGTTDWVTAFNVAAWIGVVPVFAFMWWFDVLPQRAKRAGVSTLEVIIRDLQVATYIIGEVWNWTFTLFNFVVNSVMTFVSVVTG